MTWESYCREVRPYWLFATKGYGLSVYDIDQSCPADLEPYAQAHKLQVQEQDRQMHTMGMYTLSAVSVSIGNCLLGKKSKLKYVEKPFLQETERKKEGMTEGELQRQRELFVAKLEVMKSNFELSHGK